MPARRTSLEAIFSPPRELVVFPQGHHGMLDKLEGGNEDSEDDCLVQSGKDQGPLLQATAKAEDMPIMMTFPGITASITATQ